LLNDLVRQRIPLLDQILLLLLRRLDVLHRGAERGELVLRLLPVALIDQLLHLLQLL